MFKNFAVFLCCHKLVGLLINVNAEAFTVTLCGLLGFSLYINNSFPPAAAAIFSCSAEERRCKVQQKNEMCPERFQLQKQKKKLVP